MWVMTRTKLKAEAVTRAVELLGEVYAELDEHRPDGLRYATFQLDDPTDFIGIVELETGPRQLAELEAFQRYRSWLDDWCETPPETTMLSTIGKYRIG